jgi:tetratricopeptide (TPR) repeat protein
MMKKVLTILALSPLLFSYSSKPKTQTPSAPAYIKEYNAGIEAQNRKDYTAAIQHYQNALDQKGDLPDAWNNLGYCYRLVSKSFLDKSGEAYGKAVSYAPKNAEAIEYQGEYYLLDGNIEEAFRNYQQLKAMGSDHAKELKEKLDPVLKQAQAVLKEYSP